MDESVEEAFEARNKIDQGTVDCARRIMWGFGSEQDDEMSAQDWFVLGFKCGLERGKALEKLEK